MSLNFVRILKIFWVNRVKPIALHISIIWVTFMPTKMTILRRVDFIRIASIVVFITSIEIIFHLEASYMPLEPISLVIWTFLLWTVKVPHMAWLIVLSAIRTQISIAYLIIISYILSAFSWTNKAIFKCPSVLWMVYNFSFRDLILWRFYKWTRVSIMYGDIRDTPGWLLCIDSRAFDKETSLIDWVSLFRFWRPTEGSIMIWLASIVMCSSVRYLVLVYCFCLRQVIVQILI